MLNETKAQCGTCPHWTRWNTGSYMVNGVRHNFEHTVGVCRGMNFCALTARAPSDWFSGCEISNDDGALMTIETHERWFCAAHPAFAAE